MPAKNPGPTRTGVAGTLPWNSARPNLSTPAKRFRPEEGTLEGAVVTCGCNRRGVTIFHCEACGTSYCPRCQSYRHPHPCSKHSTERGNRT